MTRALVMITSTALCVLAAIGCGTETAPPQPASFDRAGRVAFVCFETSGDAGPRPVPIARCDRAGGEGESKVAMHALVTQTSRGEVAAVDLEKERVLDSRKDVPGYTFLPVGELPSAVVVPRLHPELTYVANFGSRTVTVLRTRAFRALAVGQSATVQTVAVSVPGSATSGGPVDMVLTPQEDALLLALPDAHALLRMPIRRCASESTVDDSDAGAVSADAGAAPCRDGTLDEAAVTLVPLDLSLAQAVTSAPSSAQPEPYRKACDDSVLLPARAATATVIDPAAFAKQPEPVALALDDFCKAGARCRRRLLVADRALPVIHAIDLDALAAGDLDGSVGAPIVTGVPTSALAVTPRVPASLEDDAPETQYVYAIDATDGSVLATEDGAVIAVSTDPATPADRITFGGALRTGAHVRAISLSVVSPGIDVTADAAQYAVPESDDTTDASAAGSTSASATCTDDDYPVRSALRLRGVFLAVGASDGTVRIVDVHDMELRECRTCDPQLLDPYPVIRHRTRIYATLSEDADEIPRIAPQVTPSATVDGRTVLISVDGTTSNPTVDGLSCVPCALPLVDAYPDPRDLISLDAGAGAPLDASADGQVAILDAGPSDAAAADGGIDASTSGDAGVVDGDPTRPGIGRRCEEGFARVCALSDPWVATESWAAVFEGRIPGTRGGHGRFVRPDSADNRSGELEFASELELCDTGIQGDRDLPTGDSHKGDQLVITAELPPTSVLPSGSLRDDCEVLVKERKKGDFSIALPIVEAWDDRLVIGKKLLVPSGDVKLSAQRDDSGRVTSRPLDYELVAACFADMLMTFEVHTRNAYTVLGRSRLGFQHRVVRDASGRCVDDTAQSALVTGRAYEDEPFVNTQVSFQVASHRTDRGVAARTKPGTVLSFILSSTTPKMILDATVGTYTILPGVQPVDLRYNDIDQSLYMVDMTARGLIPIALDGFPSQVRSSFE